MRLKPVKRLDLFDVLCFHWTVKVSILSSFESRLMQLENSIIPVHKQTENLQRLQDNVDKTLSCMDHVISYYHVAKDTDRIIREGWVVSPCQSMSCQACIMTFRCVVLLQAHRKADWVSGVYSEDSESCGVLPGQQPRQPRTQHSGTVTMFASVGNNNSIKVLHIEIILY